MAKRPTWSLFVISLLAVTALSQDLDLLDAFDDVPTKSPPAKPKPQPGPAGPGGGKDLDLSDFLDFDANPTRPPRKTTTKAPIRPRPKPKPAADDFDLSDALDPKNDIPGGKGKGSKDTDFGGAGRVQGTGSVSGSSFSDSDLQDLLDNNDYKPDKGKGARGGDNIPADDSGGYDTTAETGTIAGIASAVVMALVGAVSSYISYQKKKLCFGIQQNLNSEYVKTENPDSVIFQEPPVQETRLQPPNQQ
ncbi:CD99 antigen-like protein 2 isoform X2 [Conger conger]|uniref:CD99 antigen-like protein 2 isoform X2 n=1 Tax=Conger conger TaxID=82655 RepID=UPI002A599F61|nr:CD99 antigen-like protein 2 isoform X2 [Conger conger]